MTFAQSHCPTPRTTPMTSMLPLPVLLRHATPMINPQGQPQDQIIYDPVTQLSREIIQCGSSDRTGCTKATHSTPMVGKDPEGDYAADDY